MSTNHTRKANPFTRNVQESCGGVSSRHSQTEERLRALIDRQRNHTHPHEGARHLHAHIRVVLVDWVQIVLN